jgi:hypothetical protein
MLKTKLVRGRGFHAGDVRADVAGVDLRLLPPFTTLLVRTVNTLYRVVTTPGPRIYVQGGTYLPDATAAYVGGAGIDGHSLADGWIGIGLRLRIRAGEQCVITSPILGIAIERPEGRVVH